MTSVIEDARVLMARGQISEASGVLDRQLDQNPTELEALLLRAAIELELHRNEKALALCERAAEAHPRSSEAKDALARVLHAVGRNDLALAVAYEARALLTEGDNFRQASSVYLTIVWCLRELRRYKEAVAAAEEGLLRAPDAVLAQWATVVEEEMAEAERDEC